MCSLIGFSNLTVFFEVKVEGVTAVAYSTFYCEDIQIIIAGQNA